jgi:adenylate cyclase
MPGQSISQTNKNSILFYIPERIAKILAENKIRLHRNEKLCGGILFFDLVKFTNLTVLLSESGPRGAEKLHELMTSYYDLMIDIIHQYGGTVYQFAGDSALVAFEDPVGNAQEIMSVMCACTLQMKRALNSSVLQYKNHKLGAKFALSYGEFHRVLLGDDKSYFQIGLIGPAIEAVVRAEKLAKENEIVISPEIAKTIKEHALVNFKNDICYLEKINVEPKPALEHQNFMSDISADDKSAFLKKCGHFLSPVMIEKIQVSQMGFLGEFREVTSVFIQVEGITFFDDIKKSIDQLNEIHIHLRNLSETYGGILLQGDFSDKGCVFLILFGAPVALEKKEMMAVRFALRAHESKKQFNFLKNFNIGIASGPLYCGDVGSSRRKGYSVLGESVNLASRLMDYSRGNLPSMDSKTAKSLPGNFLIEVNQDVELKGITGKSSMYRVIGESAANEVKVDRSALFGRKKELAWLNDALIESTKNGLAAGIIGDAGVGKSRLVFDFLKNAKKLEYELYTGICYSYEKFTPFFAWKSILLNIFNLHEGINADIAIKEIESVLNGLDLQKDGKIEIKAWSTVFYRLLGGLIEETSYTKNLDPKKKNEQLFEYLGNIFAHKAKSGKILVLIEDYHWIDEGSENLGRYLLDRKISGMMLLLVSRPQAPIYNLESYENYKALNLAEFTDDESGEYLRIKMNLEQSNNESENLEKEILNKAHGNPFFLESIVYSLREQGIFIKNDNDKYILSRDKNNFEIPNSIQGVLLSRIDRLGESEKLVLKNAAVIGRLFEYSLLQHLSPTEIQPKLSTYLMSLETNDFTMLESDAPMAYLFKHVLIRDVAYNSLLNSTRETLHNRIAAHLENMGEESTQENIDLLAYHFFHAKNADKAIKYSLKAARYAASNYAITDAIHHYGNILQLLDGTADNRDLLYDVKIELGHVYRHAGHLAEAMDIFQEPLSNVNDRFKLARIHTGIGQIYQEQGDAILAMNELEKALELLGSRVPKNQALATVETLMELTKRGIYMVIPFFPIKAFGKKIKILEMRFEVLECLAKIYFFIAVEKYGWAILKRVNYTDRISGARFKGKSYAELSVIYATLGLFSIADKNHKKAEKYTLSSKDPITEAALLTRTGGLDMYKNNPGLWYEKQIRALSLLNRFGEQWEKLFSMGTACLALMYSGKVYEASLFNEELAKIAFSENAKQFQGWSLYFKAQTDYILNVQSVEICIDSLQKAIEKSLSSKDTATYLGTIRFLIYILLHENKTSNLVEKIRELFHGLNNYSTIIPNAHAGYFEIIWALEVALSKNLIEKKEADKIRNNSLKRLIKLGKKFNFLTTYALRAQAKTFASNGQLQKAQKKISDAVIFLEKSQNNWERACAYYEAAVLIPDRQNELIEKGISFCKQNKYERDLIRFQKLRELQTM